MLISDLPNTSQVQIWMQDMIEITQALFATCIFKITGKLNEVSNMAHHFKPTICRHYLVFFILKEKVCFRIKEIFSAKYTVKYRFFKVQQQSCSYIENGVLR
jgi:hypothetical protein